MVGPTPSFWKIFIQIFLAWNIDDFLLYSMHRVAHSKRLYYIHKKHHQFSASTGWASEWMSPIDSFVGALFLSDTVLSRLSFIS